MRLLGRPRERAKGVKPFARRENDASLRHEKLHEGNTPANNNRALRSKRGGGGGSGSGSEVVDRNAYCPGTGSSSSKCTYNL
ncbi:hypothetical protein L249_1070 [Ophiocordyceps polyrhachis-furcata BCC 54312]|uniref:Uncharacterized protein n=1 Tax=Ophiocordyceps polyrhachis-furcata BCC 54312 TaxID=1330021 RepID=A0A367LC62_9HYPO|nr:hypothetical protein L249_1070 [Ophiocordyceps polyrhachis-furcata BCC 54312]